MTTLERIQAILRDVLNEPGLEITRDSSAQTVRGWDSLAHVDILWNVEQEFKVRFPLGEIQNLKNVGELVDLVDRKVAAKG
ncbi:MAG TPA: acyl carrier protein [Bryobacteraceae bacterium]|nr:acyl carrier protein [Bryobacteraceae bacterium]